MANMIGFALQVIGAVVTVGGLAWSWLDWVRRDIGHQFHRWLRPIAPREGPAHGSKPVELPRPTTPRPFVPGATQVDWDIHQAQRLDNLSSGRFGRSRERRAIANAAEKQRAAAEWDSARMQTYATTLADSIYRQTQAQLDLTRRAALGGLGVAAAGVLLGLVGLVVDRATTP